MNRFDKENKIKALKEAINIQKQIIELERAKLKTLEDEYTKSNVIELPILLFTLANDKKEYLYVYYYADLNKVEFVSKNNEILPNAIDFRDKLTKINMPLTYNSANVVECSEKIDYVVRILMTKIDELFLQYNIKSWQELGIYLQSLKIDELYNNEKEVTEKR